jgi:transposase
MSVRPWPTLRDEDRWLTTAMEKRLSAGSRNPDEMRARARELREQGEQSDVKGFRDAALALAERYEEAATARLGAR